MRAHGSPFSAEKVARTRASRTVLSPSAASAALCLEFGKPVPAPVRATLESFQRAKKGAETGHQPCTVREYPQHTQHTCDALTTASHSSSLRSHKNM